MVSFLVFCLLFWVSGAASGTQDTNSEQDPGTPSLLEPFVMEKEGVETLSVPPSPVLRFAFADFAATVLACFPRRRLLTPRLGGGLARFLMTFMRPCRPCSQPSLCTCSPALCRAFSYDWLSCCDCLGSAPSGCCMKEVQGFVKVNDPLVVLFNVLAVLDALCALLTAAAILCLSMFGMTTWIFQERVFQHGPQVSQAPQVVQEVQPLLREVFPECWERDRVDLARVSAKIGVPHGILCNTAFEHGLEMSVDEVRAAARSLVAYEPVGEEVNMQAAAAPSGDLRARSGEEEKSHEEKWSLPQKSVKEVFVKSLEGKLLLFSFTDEDTVLDLRNCIAMACKVFVDQFDLVFQSRTLQSSVKVESIRVQWRHTFCMQGALKGVMQRQGLMGEWDCAQCGATRVWAARTSCFRCGFKRDGSGYTSSVLKNVRESQDHFVPQPGPIRGTGTGLGRTQRKQSSGCPTARVP